MREEFPLEVLQGSLHAAEHGQIAVLPLIAMCDRWDIGGLSTAYHHQTGRPTIFIYDGHPGGVGITRAGFERFEALVGDALRLISECPCESGCPSCVQSPKCGNLNEPLNKRGAIELLSRMAAGVVATRGSWLALPMRTDEEIRVLLSRLARRHPSGGTVIERVAIVAEGAGLGRGRGVDPRSRRRARGSRCQGVQGRPPRRATERAARVRRAATGCATSCPPARSTEREINRAGDLLPGAAAHRAPRGRPASAEG